MKLYFGTPGWGWTMWGIGYKTRWFIGFTMSRKACPHDDCRDKTQCWEPCGDMGNSELHTRLVSCAPDGNTCTVNVNGTELYYDRVMPNFEVTGAPTTGATNGDEA